MSDASEDIRKLDAELAIKNAEILTLKANTPEWAHAKRQRAFLVRTKYELQDKIKENKLGVARVSDAYRPGVFELLKATLDAQRGIRVATEAILSELKIIRKQVEFESK